MQKLFLDKKTYRDKVYIEDLTEQVCEIGETVLNYWNSKVIIDDRKYDHENNQHNIDIFSITDISKIKSLLNYGLSFLVE